MDLSICIEKYCFWANWQFTQSEEPQPLFAPKDIALVNAPFYIQSFPHLLPINLLFLQLSIRVG